MASLFHYLWYFVYVLHIVTSNSLLFAALFLKVVVETEHYTPTATRICAVNVYAADCHLRLSVCDKDDEKEYKSYTCAAGADTLAKQQMAIFSKPDLKTTRVSVN